MDEIAELLRRSIDVQHRVLRVGREEQRETMLAYVDMGIVVGVRACDMDAREINADVRHLFTVSEELLVAR
jgi:hypothetical protein